MTDVPRLLKGTPWPHSARLPQTASRFLQCPFLPFLYLLAFRFDQPFTMRSLLPLLAFVTSALAYSLAGRKAVVVPATCHANVVKTVLDTLNSLNVPETIFLSTFETG
jgi:hypothetical protein